MFQEARLRCAGFFVFLNPYGFFGSARTKLAKIDHKATSVSNPLPSRITTGFLFGVPRFLGLQPRPHGLLFGNFPLGHRFLHGRFRPIPFDAHPNPGERQQQAGNQEQDHQERQETKGDHLPSQVCSLQMGDQGLGFSLGHG
jgi:hypothetical protein